ncbi:hypothetical protein COLO4_00540, partial [Corchorus olitorius]
HIVHIAIDRAAAIRHHAVGRRGLRADRHHIAAVERHQPAKHERAVGGQRERIAAVVEQYDRLAAGQPGQRPANREGAADGRAQADVAIAGTEQRAQRSERKTANQHERQAFHGSS